MAAVPSIGRATRVERPTAPGADAASDLYERYHGQIFSYCYHQLGSREEAEDAVQTTFMNAFRGLSRGIVPELESAWLFKIAHNVCLSRRRSSWRRGKVEAPNNFEVLQEVIPGREQVSDELIRLQDVLEQMPENQRRAILLREWQGLTYREISAELDLSQGAVETLIFRARRALAQGLESDSDTWRKRLRKGSDFGGIAALFQAVLSGGSAVAVKVAATAVVVATSAVAASPAVHPSHAHRAPLKAPAVHRQYTTHSLTSLSAARRAIASNSSTEVSGRARRTGHGISQPMALPSSAPAGTVGAPAAPPASAESTLPPPSAESTPSVVPADPAPAPIAQPPAPPAPNPDSTTGAGKGKRDPESIGPPPPTDPSTQPPVEAAPDVPSQPSAGQPDNSGRSTPNDPGRHDNASGDDSAAGNGPADDHGTGRGRGRGKNK